MGSTSKAIWQTLAGFAFFASFLQPVPLRLCQCSAGNDVLRSAVPGPSCCGDEHHFLPSCCRPRRGPGAAARCKCCGAAAADADRSSETPSCPCGEGCRCGSVQSPPMVPLPDWCRGSQQVPFGIPTVSDMPSPVGTSHVPRRSFFSSSVAVTAPLDRCICLCRLTL